jgi:hypothetical protein
MPDEVKAVRLTPIADGLVVFAKRVCPTCTLIEPVLRALAQGREAFRVVSQDDPGFPAGISHVVDDRALEYSFRNGIESTPTLIRYAGGREVERTHGWDVREWRRVSSVDGLGEGLPPFQPG